MLAALLVTALSASSTPAPLAFAFSWSVPGECIGAEALAQKVSLRLGRDAFVPRDQAELVLIGTVTREASSRYRAHFELRTTSGATAGTREVYSEDDDCRSLDDAAAVVISVMLNVRRADLEPVPEPEPPPPAPEPEKPAAPWQARLALGGGAVFGVLPTAAAQATLSGGAAKGLVALDVQLAFAPDSTRSIEAGTVSARAFGGTAGVMLRFASTRFELGGRLGLGGGALFVSGSGFGVDGTATGGWLDVRAGLRASVRLAGPVWLELQGDVGLVPYARSFGVRELDGTLTELYKPSTFIGSAGGAVCVRWPPVSFE